MDSSELIRQLNSVGKTAFAQHYDVFLAYADGSLTRMQAIDELVQRRVSNEAGANMRIPMIVTTDSGDRDQFIPSI